MSAETTAAMIRAWREGATFAQIAAEHGITKQAVGARVRRHRTPMDVRAARRVREARRERERQARHQAALATRSDGHECAIPGCREVVYGWRRTCGPEHSALWVVVRRAIDERERRQHRVTQAHAILRDETAHGPTRVAWARRVLDGAPPPPRRRAPAESVIEQALAELGVAA